MNIESISENYFNKLTFVSETLSRFITELRDDPVVKEAIFESEYGKMLADDEKWPHGPIVTAVLIDIANCYKFLDHKLTSHSPEGLGLVLADHYIVDPEYGSVEYADLPNDDYLQQHANRTFKQVEETSVCRSWHKKNDLFLGFMLSLIDKMYAERYVLRLYRFFEAVAKVDNEISESESEWLNNFKPFKDKYVTEGQE